MLVCTYGYLRLLAFVHITAQVKTLPAVVVPHKITHLDRDTDEVAAFFYLLTIVKWSKTAAVLLAVRPGACCSFLHFLQIVHWIRCYLFFFSGAFLTEGQFIYQLGIHLSPGWEHFMIFKGK